MDSKKLTKDKFGGFIDLLSKQKLYVPQMAGNAQVCSRGFKDEVKLVFSNTAVPPKAFFSADGNLMSMKRAVQN